MDTKGQTLLHEDMAPCIPSKSQTDEEKNIMATFKSFIKLIACFVVALSFLGCASTRTHEGTGEYVDDTVITTKVKSAIFSDSDLKVLQINVETFKGVVQLSGFVNSASSITKAREIAKSVKGVISVQTNLIVK